MPKRILILIFTIFTFVSLQSQVRYGVMVGGEFTRPGGNTQLNGGNGFSGGLQIEYRLPHCGLAASTAALYHRRTIGEGTHADGNYFALPVTLKYHFPLRVLKDLAGPFLLTGPDMAWRLNKGYGRNFHFGWNVGVGFDIINFIQLSAGYRFGLNNIATTPAKVHDNGWFVNAAILFNI